MGHGNLNYYIPKLKRRINVTLYSNVTNCYNLLELKGHINLMKRIDQLGVISKVYRSAYHSRWEYVMLHLYLVYQLYFEEKGIGLNSSVKIGKYKLSGIEILHIWILLFNSGHLPGTFASERAILRIINKNEDIKKLFLDGLPKNYNNIKTEFEEILKKQNVFSLHRIISAFNLEDYKDIKSYEIYNEKYPIFNSVKEYKDFIELLEGIIDFYFLEYDKKPIKTEEEFKNTKSQLTKLKRLKKIFKNSRLLAFLFLDSQYVEFPINFDLSKILLEFSEYSKSIFIESNSQTMKTLESFEDFLSINLYHSPETIRELGYHSMKIENEFKECPEIKDLTNLRKYLKNYFNFEPNIKKWGNSTCLYILFDLSYFTLKNTSYVLIESFNKLFYTIEKYWNVKYGEYSLMTYQPGSNQKHYPLTLYISPESKERKIELLGKFLEEMINAKSSIKGVFEESLEDYGKEILESIDKKKVDHDFINKVLEFNTTFYMDNDLDNIFQSTYQDLLIETLEKSIGNNLIFKLENENATILTVNEMKDLDEIIRKIHKESKEEDQWRLNEIMVLKKCLESFNKETLPKMLIPLSQVVVDDPIREPSDICIAEFDGFGLWVKENQWGLLLIEAKKQKISNSISDLNDKIKNLGLNRENCDIKSINEENAKGAYCLIELKG